MRSSLLAMCLMLASPAFAQDPDARTQRLATEIQHELLLLPYYGVFDTLGFVIEKGGTVRLVGQVTRPTLKSDAERKVKPIPGIDTLVNEIEVLPNSPVDDQIRIAIARAIYRTTSLEKYGFQVNPPIHIIVKNGRVSLEGVVDNDSDKAVAALRAGEVRGVFEVKNNLRVGRD